MAKISAEEKRIVAKVSAEEKRIVAGKWGLLTRTGSQSCLLPTQVGPARVCPSFRDQPH